jgi:hypothetical protein
LRIALLPYHVITTLLAWSSESLRRQASAKDIGTEVYLSII